MFLQALQTNLLGKKAKGLSANTSKYFEGEVCVVFHSGSQYAEPKIVLTDGRNWACFFLGEIELL